MDAPYDLGRKMGTPFTMSKRLLHGVQASDPVEKAKSE
jgi:hypothetical protein